jgi:SPP1 family predicted phage head-tail adaptor
MAKAGVFRHRIDLESPVRTRNDQGETVVSSWNIERTIWARIEPFGGREYADDRKVTTEQTHRISIRWQPNLDIKADWRIAYGSRVFEIDSPPINIDERDRELVFVCRETDRT